jgi:hypothetical protein
MADVLAVVVALAVFGVGFPALLTLASLCFPGAVDRAERNAGVRPVRSLVLGAAALFVVVAAAAVLGNALGGPGKLLGAVGLLGGLGVAMVGGAGLARHLAGAYRRQTGSGPRVPDVVAGAVLLELASALPLAGWFVVLPAAFLVMLGAGCAAVLRWRPRAAAERPAIGYQPQAQ